MLWFPNANGAASAVSPWFFTHFASKNWAFVCEDQPTRRWEQILQLKPDLVEIVTWNDFGESHYISYVCWLIYRTA